MGTSVVRSVLDRFGAPSFRAPRRLLPLQTGDGECVESYAARAQWTQERLPSGCPRRKCLPGAGIEDRDARLRSVFELDVDRFNAEVCKEQLVPIIAAKRQRRHATRLRYGDTTNVGGTAHPLQHEMGRVTRERTLLVRTDNARFPGQPHKGDRVHMHRRELRNVANRPRGTEEAARSRIASSKRNSMKTIVRRLRAERARACCDAAGTDRDAR